MKPSTARESRLRWNISNPHDVWLNGDEARRIARRRWKRARSKHIRRVNNNHQTVEVS